jgi:hypothetical protein
MPSRFLKLIVPDYDVYKIKKQTSAEAIIVGEGKNAGVQEAVQFFKKPEKELIIYYYFTIHLNDVLWRTKGRGAFI